MSDKLTPKQSMFVQEYLVDFNGTQACIRAGYSAKCADVMATKLVANGKIQARIQVGMRKREEKIGVTQADVLQFWCDIALTPLDELFDTGPDGTLVPKSFDAMTTRAKRCISEIACYYDKDGNGSQKIKRLDQIKASEMIAKHMGMFIERSEIGQPGDFDKLNDDELNNRIAEEKRFFSNAPRTNPKGRERPSNPVH